MKCPYIFLCLIQEQWNWHPTRYMGISVVTTLCVLHNLYIISICIILATSNISLYRCTFSYPTWVFVFIASVNYKSRCHGSFLNSVTCHDLHWGNWWETIPWMPLIHIEGKSKNTDNLYQASDFNGEACKTQASMRPGNHLHLIIDIIFLSDTPLLQRLLTLRLDAIFSSGRLSDESGTPDICSIAFSAFSAACKNLLSVTFKVEFQGIPRMSR